MHAYLPNWEERELLLQDYPGLRGASGGLRGERVDIELTVSDLGTKLSFSCEVPRLNYTIEKPFDNGINETHTPNSSASSSIAANSL
jgi:hypothetical protein